MYLKKTLQMATKMKWLQSETDVFEFKALNRPRNLPINSAVNAFGFFSDLIIVADYSADSTYIANWSANRSWSFVDLLDNHRGTIKRFLEFAYGKKINVITGYKHPMALLNNPSAESSTRIERWLMELRQYPFILECRTGSSNSADYAWIHHSTEKNSLGSLVTLVWLDFEIARLLRSCPRSPMERLRDVWKR